MSDEVKYLNCSCYHCETNLEFPAEGVGRKIQCLFCGKPTWLDRPEPTKERGPRTLLESYHSFDIGHVFTVTLSSGGVRYIRPERLFNADVEYVIAQIKQLSTDPKIEDPYYRVTLHEWRNKHGQTGEYEIRYHPLFSMLFERETWEAQLRLHHAFGQINKSENMTPDVYYLFHSHLCLGGQFAFAECLEAWVKGTEKDRDLRESYQTSPEHIKVPSIDSTGGVVYRKTEFVKEKLLASTGEAACKTRYAEAQKVKAYLERLRRSRFRTFVYLMEDRRNKLVKIGQSEKPWRREGTLQSEVPEVILRFAIPADKEVERMLHRMFKTKRKRRSEWFSLTANDVRQIVDLLKIFGDGDREEADGEWLGRF